MSIFKEIPPTSGWTCHARDIFSLFRKNKSANLAEDFKGYLGAGYAEVTYSGTAALYLILESLKKISTKRTILIPAYVCPLVALAAQKAGLKVKVCDINKDNFDFDYTAFGEFCAQGSDILAVIVIHLGGVMMDFDRIKSITQNYEIFIIEDCAQALGAEYKGRKAGTLGDFSFFSLARGKGLTIYEGGVVVSNKEKYFQVLEETIKSLVRKNYLSELLKIFELFGYWIFYRPCLFWFVFKLPQVFWKQKGNEVRAFGEEYGVDFDYHKVSFLRKFFGHLSFYRLEKEIDSQRQKALYYIKNLSGISGLRAVQENPGTKAVYPFLTLLFDDINKRNLILKTLDSYGLGVSIVYVNAICDYGYLKPTLSLASCENARGLSRRQLTLSTSAFLKEQDLELIVETIKKLMSE
ncbi:MAG: DegT/DnrJ/EryC1/StrS family aminotransferase [Candidatus Omnitrophota bacterium]